MKKWMFIPVIGAFSVGLITGLSSTVEAIAVENEGGNIKPEQVTVDLTRTPIAADFTLPSINIIASEKTQPAFKKEKTVPSENIVNELDSYPTAPFAYDKDVHSLASPVPQQRITSPFGWRPDPFTGSRVLHIGTDFSGGIGSPIYSAESGVIIEAGNTGNTSGNYIIIQHSDKIYTKYSHLSTIEVNPGDVVTRGERIGGMGSTGRSTGTHLHFEVWFDGEYTNPMQWLNGQTFTGSTSGIPVNDSHVLSLDATRIDSTGKTM